MTVVSEVSANQYISNGVITEFDYKFKIFSEHHLVVIIADSNGDHEKRLTLNRDYTVTGVNCDEGGTIILRSAIASGNILLVERDLPATQQVSFGKFKQFHEKIHENAFDYVTMLVQRARANLSLFLHQPSVLANYFDVKNHRIANIRQPKSDADVVNFSSMKSAIHDKDIRSLRVDDIAMSALPDAESRKNKRLGFDDDSQPMLFDADEFGVFDYLLVYSFEKGFVITTRYQALHYVQDDSYYRWTGKLLKEVPENSTPESTGGTEVGAWKQIIIDLYSKKEIDNQFVKVKDSRIIQFAGLDLVRTDNYSGISMKNNIQHISLYVSGNSAYTILARNSNNTIKYSISFPTYSATLAATNTLDNITVYGFNAIHPTGDAVIRLGAAKIGYDLVYARNSKRFFMRNNNTYQVTYLPEKHGTFAIQEDNY